MKKIKIWLIVIGAIIIIAGLGIGAFFWSLQPVSNNSELVDFVIKPGTSAKKVINNLYDANLIKSTFFSNIYLKLNKDIAFKAGSYKLYRNESTSQIFSKLASGDVVKDTFNVTFIEGKRITDFVSTISEKFGYKEDEIYKTISDKSYLQELIKKYDFLTDDILNSDIYYPLEGYLYPSTYEFYKDASIKTIIEKMLDKTKNVLDNINASGSNYSIHELLTIASIIENETKFPEDRSIVSQVIRKRLDLNMNLGMDVTTYYAAKKSMKEELTKSDLNNKNAYNTRNSEFIGLPVGPICNPRKESIEAALKPSNTDYIYFYADVYGMNDNGTCNTKLAGKLHFATTYNDFQKLISKYSKKCI